MSVELAIAVFAVSFAVGSLASVKLASGLEQLGVRYRFSEGMLGIVMAFGADSPEITSAIIALIGGNHDLGLGVVFGSNIFNLSALLGFAALAVGSVRADRGSLLLNGGVAVLVTLVAIGLVLGDIVARLSLLLLIVVIVPYIILLALRPSQIARSDLPVPLRLVLSLLVSDVQVDVKGERAVSPATWRTTASVVLMLVLVVLTSLGMVQAAIDLAQAWGVSHLVLGMLVLAALTSIPNTVAAVRLALRGRDAAVISETFNSNTLNILSGIAIPAVIIGNFSVAGGTIFAAWWLLALTAGILLLGFVGRALSRWDGAAVLAVYAVFAAIIIFGT